MATPLRTRMLKSFRRIVAQIPRLKHAMRYLGQSEIADDPLRRTPMGFKFAGNEAMQAGNFEVEERELVQSLLPDVDVVVNVGANIGYYACLALSQNKHVLAFEPMPQNVQYLLRNIRANGWDSKVEVFPVALSNRTGVAEIFGDTLGASLVKGWAGTPEYSVTLVPTLTMDGVLGNRLTGKRCLILVDIEGAEQLMLEGARETLSMSPKPIWMVEITVREHQPTGLNPTLATTFRTFWERGYEARTADCKRRLIEPDEIEAVVRTGNNTLGTYNFLFADRESHGSSVC